MSLYTFSLIRLGFAMPNELQERAFQPVRQGWLAVTKLGKEGSCGNFDGTEQRLRSKGDDECIPQGRKLFVRKIIHVIEEIGVEAAPLLCKLQGSVSDTFHVPKTLLGTAAPHGGAGVQYIVPYKACFARQIRCVRIILGMCVGSIRNASRAIEYDFRRAPDRK